MSTPDRLEELKRQRALLEEQIARLDQEAAAAPVPKIEPEVAATGPLAGAADADQALEKFADAPENPAEVKRGCLVAFVLGLTTFVAVLVGIYLLFYR